MRYKPCKKSTRRTVNPMKTLVPALLRVSRESRAVGLEHYELCKYYPEDKTPLYFNLKADILLLVGDNIMFYYAWSLLRNIMNPDSFLFKVRYMALGALTWNGVFGLRERQLWPVVSMVYEMIRKSKALERIHILETTVVAGRASELHLVDTKESPTWWIGLQGPDYMDKWMADFRATMIKHPEWNEPEIRFGLLERRAHN